MRIARVVTVCVALISAPVGAETEHLNRRSQPKDHQPQPRSENDTDVSEITFTTLRPEVTSFSKKTYSSVRPGSNGDGSRFRVTHRLSPLVHVPVRFQSNRRRRQLQRVDKKNRLGGSYDVINNHVDTQQIEAIQGPAEAFDEGVVHIEPIYRVSKHSNVFDSMVDIVRRVLNPEKTLGPLVGPFYFPGVGDKVYVRTLEKNPPDHLVIRLITRPSPAKTEHSFDKEISPPSVIIDRSKIPSIDHQTVVLTGDKLTGSFDRHGDVSSITGDSLISSSNAVQTVKPSSDPKIFEHSQAKGSSATLRANRHTDTSAGQTVARRRKPIVGNRANWSTHRAHVQTNSSLEDGRYRANSDRDSFDQGYRFHPSIEWNEKSAEPLNANVRAVFQNPLNISISRQTAQADHATLRSMNDSDGLTEDRSKYSIEFVSKKMRYLNLDGSVDGPSEKSDDEGFKPIDPRVVSPNLSGPIASRSKKAIESSPIPRRDHRHPRERSRAFPAIYRMLNGDRTNHSTSAFANRTETGSRRRCCDGENENEGKRAGWTSFDEHHKNGTSFNYSTWPTPLPTSTVKQALIEERSETRRNSTESRSV